MTNNKLSLVTIKQLSDIPDSIRKIEPAHVSRYLITAHLIKQMLIGVRHPKVLDVGGKKGLLREFGIKSTIIDIEDSDEEDFIQGDALNMPFEDDAFDVVVTCDVLEHIPAGSRDRFVSEILRVSKGYVIIGAPFNQSGVSTSEINANEFYKSISKQEHRWLIEHIDNGLPEITALEENLKKHKVEYRIFRHLSLDVWLNTTKLHFLNAVFGDSKKLNKLAHDAYDGYYSSLCEFDYSDNGYRTFCIINKKTSFSLDLPDSNKQLMAKTKYKDELNEQTINALSGLGAERRRLIKINKTTDLKAEDLQNRLDILQTELRYIKESRSWKLAQKISRLKNLGK